MKRIDICVKIGDEKFQLQNLKIMKIAVT